MESWLCLLMVFRQRQPELQAMQPVILYCDAGAFTFRMGDATAGHHQVNVAGADGLEAADGIPMENLALEQVGHGCYANVRMRAHIDALPRRKIRRPHFIKKDPGANHFLFCSR